MKKFLFILCTIFILFFAGLSSLMLVLFTTNIFKNFRIDELEATVSLPIALALNIGLLLLFGGQHSIMARQQFKALVKKWIPEELERMFYVIMSSIALAILVWFWQPMPIVIWDIKIEWIKVVLYTFFFLGWFLVLVSSNIIDGLRLIGIRQLATHFLDETKTTSEFKTPFLYKIVRHPLYLGFLIAFWITPIMTLSHLVFSIGMTIYILIGIRYEEKDLEKDFGEKYQNYRKTTPKLFPKKLSLD